MKSAIVTTKKLAADRRKTLQEKINYSPEKAAKAWRAIAGIWKDRSDIDPLIVRAEAWSHQK